MRAIKAPFVARAWPCCALLLALSAMLAIPKDRGYLYPFNGPNDVKNLALAENLSLPPGFLFWKVVRRPDGRLRYVPYHRFPWAGFAVTKLAMAPFAGDMSTQLAAARMLMLLFWCAAAVLTYCALARLTGNRPLALLATLLAFSSYHMLNLADAVSNEVALDLFGVALTFHGMVVFAQTRRFGQLAIKTCVALLFGWHVYALLAPFVLFGLAVGAAAAWRCAEVDLEGAGGAAWRRWAALLWRGLTRGRHGRLALVAFLFGAAQLGGNLALERAALGGVKPFAEWPSVVSMFWRMGFVPAANVSKEQLEAGFDWSDFFEWQFHRVGGMALPHLAYSWMGDIEQRLLEDEETWRERDSPRLAAVGVVALVLTAGGLLCSGRRARVLAPLALCGMCWAVPMRENAGWAVHEYESVFHFGVPLVGVTLLPLLGRRLRSALRPAGRKTGRSSGAPGANRWTALAAAGAAGVFVLSHARLVDARRDPEYAAAWKAVMAEFDAIRALAHRRDVLVLGTEYGFAHTLLGMETVRWFTAGLVVRNVPSLPESAALAARLAPDFVISRKRVATPSLRTPRHKAVFLYDSPQAIDAISAHYEREYQRVASSPAVVRSVWDIHLDDGALVYLKTPCAGKDVFGRFYLHAERRSAPGDFSTLYSDFRALGARTERGCAMAVPLPDSPVARVRTGFYWFNDAEPPWRTAFRLDLDVLRSARAAAFGGRDVDAPLPAVPGFQVRQHGNALVYLRKACAAADVEARFFLHVTPAAARALPPARRAAGFDNLDFAFGEHGAVVDGDCVIEAPLPSYWAASARTGQFANGVEIWSARLEWADDAAGR